ncbi:ABC transporter substrate-binding protein [Microbacterium sp. ARD32]|uniref:ABC transporter substrate-binding protein n=1 Tax=Microbacterium sp. ARD32 TaxID=2962577 RepID=UPI002880CBE6|nr:ABC transporter substrate-binding protein [Microbacterium sp. ARD32]MDT0158137.1 ABC transporter substrate-binding protein [Microbacterium sp. ARD32]
MRIRTPHPVAGGALIAIGAALVLTGCTPSSAPPTADADSPALGIPDDDYSLDALIDAAKKEDPIVVYDVTGKVVDTAKAFTAKYGIKATGVKAKANEQQEIMTREAQSGNVQGDVYLMTDEPAVSGELIPSGAAVSWFPPSGFDEVPERYRSPLAVSTEIDAWTYNTEVYGESCPVDNMWALTTDEWKGKVALSDPLLRADFLYWVNQMQTHADDKVAAAYQDQFGTAIDTSKQSASAQWLEALAGNKPIIKQSGGDVAEAIGASGQTAPPVGMVSTAEYRSNADSGYHLGLCTDLMPWLGRSYAKSAVIATGTDSPNAAKLFIQYMLTEEGIAPQLIDGKFSTNAAIAPSDAEPSGIADLLDQVFDPDPATAADDYDALPEWQDAWTVSSH